MLVIADIGSNWKTKGDCIASIYEAKRAGADVVKFQCYTYRDMYGLVGKMKAELPVEWLGALKEAADKFEIQLMCTAFSPRALKRIDPHVDYHKIASSDMCYPQLLDAAMETGKPLIISTGGKTETQIARVMSYVEPYRHLTSFLYCSASYPCRDHDLRKIDRLMEMSEGRFGVGYSDHTLDMYYAPYQAVYQHGASIVEKHMTCIDMDSPDRPHSLTSAQFACMTSYLRDKDDPVCNYADGEIDMVLKHNRRLVAIKHIKKGDFLKFGVNYGAFRIKEDCMSAYSQINPMDWKKIEGIEASRDIRPGYAL